MSCWICKQRAELRRQKKKQARSKARELAGVIRETVAIIKEGPNYRVLKSSEAVGLKVLEYVS